MMKWRLILVILAMLALSAGGFGGVSSASEPRPQSLSRPAEAALGQAAHRGPGLASYDPGDDLGITPPSDDPSPTLVAASDDPPAAPSPTPAPAVAAPAPARIVPGAPLRLRIPAIGVDTRIESVGLAANGGMGIPSTPFVVAWYSPGPRPGEPGNAVIDGHLDHPGGPGVFWSLGDLKPGDKVLVETAPGKWKTFVVSYSAEYPYDQSPIDLIFGPSLTANLNLITCEGVFDHSQHNYNQRRVVYTHLQE